MEAGRLEGLKEADGMKRWMMGLLALLLLAPAVGLCGAGEGMTVMVATDLH